MISGLLLMTVVAVALLIINRREQSRAEAEGGGRAEDGRSGGERRVFHRADGRSLPDSFRERFKRFKAARIRCVAMKPGAPAP